MFISTFDELKVKYIKEITDFQILKIKNNLKK